MNLNLEAKNNHLQSCLNKKIAFLFDHVEGYVPQHAFLYHVPNLMKIIMSNHIVLLTGKLLHFK